MDDDLLEGVAPPEDFKRKMLIIDTNALMSPFQFGYNLDLELERALPGVPPVIPTSVLRELDKLASKGERAAKAALKLSRKYQKVGIKGSGDAPIYNLAVNLGWPVMTLDRKLKEKLLERGVLVLILREKGHLEVVEP